MQFVVCPKKSRHKVHFWTFEVFLAFRKSVGTSRTSRFDATEQWSRFLISNFFPIAQERGRKVHCRTVFIRSGAKSKVDRQQWSELWCKGFIKSIFPPAHLVQGCARVMNWLSGAETTCTLTMDSDLSTFWSELFALVRRAERRVYRLQIILSSLVIFSSSRDAD